MAAYPDPPEINGTIVPMSGGFFVILLRVRRLSTPICNIVDRGNALSCRWHVYAVSPGHLEDRETSSLRTSPNGTTM